MSQKKGTGLHTSLPPGQLLLHDRSEKPEKIMGANNYLQRRFHLPDYLPVTILSKNIYAVKYVHEVDVFDKGGQPAYVFELSPRGELQSGKIISDHLIRWCHYRIAENMVTSVVEHYDKQGNLARLDSVITSYYTSEPADTVVSYTSSSHWVYLAGVVVNDRNNYYNDTYFRKRVSIAETGLNAQQDQKAKEGKIYLKKKLPVNYKKDSIYLDRFFQEDKNFVAIAYSDTGKTEVYQQLPLSHYIKKRYHPVAKKSYGTAGADFDEPGFNADDEIDLAVLGYFSTKGPMKQSPGHYKCSLTRRGLIDSIFTEDQTTTSLIYTVRYHYTGMAFFSGNEYEPEPQIILSEQQSSYGRTYFLANFNKVFEMPSGKSVWPGDVTAFVKNRVKTIHVYYGRRELQAFDLDTAGRIIGGMEQSGQHRWKSYTDKTGIRFSCNDYYDGYGWLEKKDSSVYIPKTIRHKDTTFTYERMESFSYKKGVSINERNRNYNEEYLNKRIKLSDGLGAFATLDPDDPRGKKEGYIYLKEALKTNYEKDQLYLCVRSTGDYAFKVTKDTTDITDSIPNNHRIKKKLIRPEVLKKMVSGEDFNPPYGGYSGPICGGSGYGSHYESPNEGSIFHSFSWTLNSKGLYDTCYKTSPVYPSYPGKHASGGSGGSPGKDAPAKAVLYTVKYDYY